MAVIFIINSFRKERNCFCIFRELGGEDPDNESLEARIDVFEQRLNKKKEELLEKDLILDEINNLSGKLRSEALDNR